MDYEGITTLEQLINDSGATEFQENVLYIPVDKFADDFYQWADTEAPSDWGDQYRPMLKALSRLVRAEISYDTAMAMIAKLQARVQPAANVEEDDDEEEVPDPEYVTADQEEEAVGQGEEGTEEHIPDPAEAAKEAVAAIGPTIIEQLQRDYPEFASRLTPEQLSAAAMLAIGEAISQQ
jgi:hypothetical protein